jgi:RND family efflux transporter MFP subunit
MSPDHSSTRKRRGVRRLLLPALILGAGLVGAMGLVASRPEPVRAVKPRQDPVVSVARLRSHSAPLVVEGTGTVRPTAEITLSAEVSGRVAMVSAEMVRGGAFKEGDVLLRIEDQSYRNAVAIARAEVEQRRVDLALAAQNQSIAEQEYELLRARLGTRAPADTSLAARLARKQPQYEAALASLHRAEAQLADAELDLSRTVVRAPFSGRVRSETVDMGQVISAGQTVAEIYGTDAVEVDISLSTRQAALIDDLWTEAVTDRTPAVVRAEFGGTWHEWEGFVEHASGALDQATRTVEVVIRVPDPFDAGDARPPLLVGSYVRASIAGRASSSHYALPRSALRDGPSVWVVDEEETLRALEVGVIQEVQDTVFVQGALNGGERIVVSDLTVMTDGMSVRVAEEAERMAASSPDEDQSDAAVAGDGP